VEVILNEERDTDSGTYIGFRRDVNNTLKTQSHVPCFTFLFRRHKLRQKIPFGNFILEKKKCAERTRYFRYCHSIWKYNNESKLNSIHSNKIKSHSKFMYFHVLYVTPQDSNQHTARYRCTKCHVAFREGN
jgi:hypothetical protein